MKRILGVFLVPLVMLIFCGPALAKDKDAGKACDSKKETQQIVAPVKNKVEPPRINPISLFDRYHHDNYPQANGHDKKPVAPSRPMAQIDKNKYVQCIPHHRPPRYCTEILNYFCDELCGDVSPSRCGGSHKWGKKCSPGLMKKCQRCGMLE